MRRRRILWSSLENDNPVSEDPFFLVKLIEKVNSPWLRALPDFGNTLAAQRSRLCLPRHRCHVRRCLLHLAREVSETNSKGITVHVDMAKTFGFMKQHGYKGYCSMEWDDAGDPYQGTAELIETTCSIFRRQSMSLDAAASRPRPQLSVCYPLGLMPRQISACAKRSII